MVEAIDPCVDDAQIVACIQRLVRVQTLAQVYKSVPVMPGL